MDNFQKCLHSHLSKAGISNWVILSLCQLFFFVVVVVVVVVVAVCLLFCFMVLYPADF